MVVFQSSTTKAIMPIPRSLSIFFQPIILNIFSLISPASWAKVDKDLILDICLSKIELRQKSLIDLNGPVNLANEPEAGPKADATREQEEREGDDEHVTKVEHGRYEACDLELRQEIPYSIKVHVQRSASAAQEAAPPPVVVLITELKVAHHNGDLRTRCNKDEKYYHQKSEDVVNLSLVRSTQRSKSFVSQYTRIARD
jgi:hypothetical protein